MEGSRSVQIVTDSDPGSKDTVGIRNTAFNLTYDRLHITVPPRPTPRYRTFGAVLTNANEKVNHAVKTGQVR
jgi:hypothetical protein